MRRNNMTSLVPYVTDEFLREFKTEFVTKYTPLYKSNNKEALIECFQNSNHVELSDIPFEFRPLEIELDGNDYDASIVRRNIRRVRDSLAHLTPVQAELEKIWVALAHREYIDYQIGVYEAQIATMPSEKKSDNSLKSRTIFVNGRKRSLAIHNLAILWWLGYYFEDPSNEENPYHLLDFFVSTPYRGNAVALLSSNIISSKEIGLGILDAVKELVETDVIGINRYAYSEPVRLLNEIGGVRILDALTRREVKNIIVEQLPKFGDNLKLLKV